MCGLHISMAAVINSVLLKQSSSVMCNVSCENCCGPSDVVLGLCFTLVVVVDVLIVKGEVQAACLQYVYNLYALCTACVLSSVWTVDGTWRNN